MPEWLSTYNDSLGMHHAAMITTIFGAFAVAFTVCICWPKMVEAFGPAGGMACAAIIVGTFWVMNHKLPGFGIHPELITGEDGKTVQYGLIHQGYRMAAPWVDMGFAIACGPWFLGVIEARSGRGIANTIESLPRVGLVLLGGAIGGAIVGLSGFTGAELFGWENMAAPLFPGK